MSGSWIVGSGETAAPPLVRHQERPHDGPRAAHQQAQARRPTPLMAVGFGQRRLFTTGVEERPKPTCF